MGTRWGGRAAQAARARLAPLVASGSAVCWRCRTPIHPDQRWHVGHLVDIAQGGNVNDPLNHAPEHGRCNERAGGQLAQAMARQARRPLASPSTIPTPTRPRRNWT